MEAKLTFIRSKAQQLFNKYGIRSITMDDVAKEAGISKKTLYQFIQNKDELVESVMEAEREYRTSQFHQILNKGHNAIEELFEVNKLIRQMLNEYNPSMEYDLRRYYPQIYAQQKEKKRKGMYESILNNIKKGKEEGLFRKELNEEIISKLYVGRVENVCESDIFTEEEYKQQGFTIEIMNYHIRGITNEEGIRLWENKLREMKNEQQTNRNNNGELF